MLCMPCAAAELVSERFELDGRQREYLLYVPDNAARMQSPRPLVLVLHGGGGTDRGMAKMTRHRFERLADRDGFYVAYPRAVDRMWQFADAGDPDSRDGQADDLGYFQAVLERVAAAYPVDPQRVFATGISRGGQASYFLACRLPGRIRAIAPFAMPLPGFLEDDCRQGPAVALLLANGTRDPLVPYDGGPITVFRRERGEVLSSDATVDLWRRRNGCTASLERAVLDPVDDGMDVHLTRWADCNGSPVVLVRISGGGHTWPSGRQYLPTALIGPVNRDVDGADIAWEFFRALR